MPDPLANQWLPQASEEQVTHVGLKFPLQGATTCLVCRAVLRPHEPRRSVDTLAALATARHLLGCFCDCYKVKYMNKAYPEYAGDLGVGDMRHAPASTVWTQLAQEKKVRGIICTCIACIVSQFNV